MSTGVVFFGSTKSVSTGVVFFGSAKSVSTGENGFVGFRFRPFFYRFDGFF